ncbi:MAG: rhamnan synthesis F family protein [Candidatus Methanomethyliaceae archaeon]
MERKYLLILCSKALKILANQGPGALLEAFLRWYRQQKSSALNDIPWESLEEAFCITASDLITSLNSKIAVIVHAYYIEIFEEICSYLKNIPWKFDLFISVKNTADLVTAETKARQLHRANHIDIRIVPNKGRNIAPLLVEFGPILREFDFICHLHTKKSLYKGMERVDWRRYLYEMLLGTEERVRAILTIFTRDPTIGIIYPEVYENIPYWAHSWLRNKGIAQHVVQKLGIRFDPDQYLDYPVGAMFWARREALEPLLDLGLTWDDFPEEQGQTDGTLHHTLERCLTLAAHSRGLKHVVIKDTKTHQFSYRSHRNLHQYFSVPFDVKVRSQLPSVKVVSFDVFDTLLLRPFASPEMVFSYLEECAVSQMGIDRYQEKRKQAELVARESKDFKGDVKISEIYAAFAKLTGCNSDISKRLMELEIATECKIIRPRDQVVELAREVKAQGKRVILVSDTYFENRQLENILYANGINFYDKLYVSSELGKRKDRGDLWDYVLESEKIDKSELLHIGDNEVSDIQLLGDKGFRHPVHVMKPSVMFRQTALGHMLYEETKPWRGWREDLLYGMIANKCCTCPAPQSLHMSKPRLDDPFLLGYVVFGPIVFSFLTWLIRVALEDGVKDLKFITREGYFLSKAYDTFLNHKSFKAVAKDFPKGSYFICSRRAVVFAALRTEQDINNLLERHFNNTLRYFFTKRLQVENITAIEKRLGKETLDSLIILPRDYDKVYRYIVQVFDILVQQAERERDALLRYCREQGLKPSIKVGLVDLGYSGTIQKTLSSLLNAPLVGYYFVTDEGARSLRERGLMSRACFGEYVSYRIPNNPFKEYSLTLEAVFTGPSGQLIKFEQTANGITPIYGELGISQNKFVTVSKIQEGILGFIQELLDLFETDALKIQFPQDVLGKYLEDIVARRFEIGELEKLFWVEDNYCGNGEVPVLHFYRNKKISSPFKQ